MPCGKLVRFVVGEDEEDFRQLSWDWLMAYTFWIGIMLAYADTSLVWATHETVASHFDNLANSSWIMTSFAIGYCVTLPLVFTSLG